MTTALFIDHFARKLENLASSSILKGQGKTKPALMPTFSARLSPKSHFPGPNTGIVFGLFLSVKSQKHFLR
ncbi:hypothetical protein AB73_0889 [Escherichia coli 3-020-07_S1_C3]|uniref:hypothetical protein n=1 Tax=Escherichia coli TaxID=562 RepID=UPI0004D5DF8F|nr:hypothetical protein [Escherichia coli]KDZ25042.1 hypothetical protein AB15_0974 [Escherichia coli 3-020-07_S1_C1]KDZ29499.1 hypothetical protein AB43_0275 [Escherichia coli 3-020-07_S1_C2]KDZ34183.1 hypothetical protein AB73_0889 [Escherichia coli 3-020-07_S1_C3]